MRAKKSTEYSIVFARVFVCLTSSTDSVLQRRFSDQIEVGNLPWAICPVFLRGHVRRLIAKRTAARSVAAKLSLAVARHKKKHSSTIQYYPLL